MYLIGADLHPGRATAVIPLGGEDLVVVVAELETCLGPGVEVVLDRDFFGGLVFVGYLVRVHLHRF